MTYTDDDLDHIELRYSTPRVPPCPVCKGPVELTDAPRGAEWFRCVEADRLLREATSQEAWRHWRDSLHARTADRHDDPAVVALVAEVRRLRARLDEDDDYQDCERCHDSVYTLSTDGLCDGCVEYNEQRVVL